MSLVQLILVTHHFGCDQDLSDHMKGLAYRSLYVMGTTWAYRKASLPRTADYQRSSLNGVQYARNSPYKYSSLAHSLLHGSINILIVLSGQCKHGYLFALTPASAGGLLLRGLHPGDVGSLCRKQTRCHGGVRHFDGKPPLHSFKTVFASLTLKFRSIPPV